jgi:hypothetical protein
MLSAKVARMEEEQTTKLGSRQMPNTNLGHVREYTEIETGSDVYFPESHSGFLSKSRQGTPLRAVALNAVSNSERHEELERKPSTGMENEDPSPVQSYKLIENENTRGNGMCRTMASLPSLRTEARDHKGEGLPLSASQYYPSGQSRRQELLKRRQLWRSQTGENGSPVKSSPGLTQAVERQFGTGISPVQRKSWRDELARSSSSHASDGEGIDMQDFAPGSAASDRKGPGMVDSFLMSRRRRMYGTSTSSGEGSSPAMFL